MRVTSVTLCNLQSWKGENSLELSPSSLNVLKAPSETGKSTSTRFLIKFCQNSDDYTDLIRSGCDTGGMIFDYDDGSSLMMLMERNGRMLGYSDSEGNVIESFTNDQINEQVLQRYGIMVDEKNGILMNVFSRDLPLLFVNTTELFNGATLSRILVNRDIEKAIDNLKEQEDSLISNLKYHGIKREQIIKACESLRYKDVNSLMIAKNKTFDLLPLAKYLQRICDTSRELKRIDSERRGVPEAPIKSSNIKYIKDLNSLVEELKSKQTKYDEILARLAGCRAVPITIQYIDQYIGLSKICTEVRNILDKCTSLKAEYEQVVQAYKESQIELKQIQETLKVCPLCGGKFSDEGCHNHN